MKFKALVVCAVLAITASACRKRAAVPAPEVTIPSAPTGSEAQMAASNATVLTAMLQTFLIQNGRLPKEISELEKVKGYGPIPKAPAGYKFVIDEKQKQVLAVRQ